MFWRGFRRPVESQASRDSVVSFGGHRFSGLCVRRFLKELNAHDSETAYSQCESAGKRDKTCKSSVRERDVTPACMRAITTKTCL